MARQTWILTSSPDNHVATEELGVSVIGVKERNRNRALQFATGDRIVLYLTKVMSFAASIEITGDMYEERTTVWPGKPGNPDIYPWRFPARPELVLPEPDWVPAERLKTDLEHVRKWPAEHWKLAFQGQLRPVTEADAAVLVDALRAAGGVPA